MTKVYNVTRIGTAKQIQSVLKGNFKIISEGYDQDISEIYKDIKSSLKTNRDKTQFICNSKD